MSWRDHSNQVLAKLFVIGQPEPTDEQIRDAYPFGERKYHPYKIWLSAVKEWRALWKKGLSNPEARRQP